MISDDEALEVVKRIAQLRSQDRSQAVARFERSSGAKSNHEELKELEDKLCNYCKPKMLHEYKRLKQFSSLMFNHLDNKTKFKGIVKGINKGLTKKEKPLVSGELSQVNPITDTAIIRESDTPYTVILSSIETLGR